MDILTIIWHSYNNHDKNVIHFCKTGPVNVHRNPYSFLVCVFCSSVPVSHYCSLKNTLPQDSDFLATACHQTFGTSSTPLSPSLPPLPFPSLPSSPLFLFSSEKWLFCLCAVLCRATVAEQRIARPGPSLYYLSSSPIAPFGSGRAGSQQQASLISALPHKLPHANLIYRWMKLRKEGGEQKKRGEQQSRVLLLIFTELAMRHSVDIPQTLCLGIVIVSVKI